jgi:hypothetical protein
MIRNKDMDSSYGQTEDPIKVYGKTENKMAEEFTQTKMEKNVKGFGHVEKN